MVMMTIIISSTDNSGGREMAVVAVVAVAIVVILATLAVVVIVRFIKIYMDKNI